MKCPGLRRLDLSARRLPRLLLVALVGAVLALALACGNDEIDPNATATPRPPDTIAPELRTPLPTPLPTNTPAPTPTRGVPEGGFKFALGVNGDAFEFDKGVLFAQAGEDVELTLNNVSTINQHNWVLVPDGAKDDVAIRGTTFPNDGWLDPDDPQVIFNTSLVDAGASAVIKFTAPDVGTYQFVCTFPGHNVTMFGQFIVN